VVLSESAFHTAVAAWLLDSFQQINHEPTLDSGRRPDFVVHTPFRGYVVEVEDSADTLYTGVGQALVYARETGFQPVVVFPATDAPPPDTVPDAVRLVTV
jgi:hypothetical protein